MPKVLIVDDSPSSIRMLSNAFENTDVEALTAASSAEALDAIVGSRPDVVLLDIVLPDRSGLETFESIHALDPTLPVIFITATGTSGNAIGAMRLGGLDFLVKPLDFEKVRETVFKAIKIRRFMHVPVRMQDENADDASESDPFIGRCPAMQEVYKAIGRVAPQNIPVLIRGESGTGKELVARAIYQHGQRSNKPFLAVNCAAIPETLLESELFGHEKGAFTGAVTQRIGKFEQCHNGTLFLDEVGDMTPLMQSKVLRILQDKRFERVGGNETIASDVRIVAATNRNLEGMVAGGLFRSDLYYRLNWYSITLPPLRERGEDMPLLVNHFLKRFAAELGKPVCSVAPETIDILSHYSWPGNVRELQSTIKQALIRATGTVLLSEFLPHEFQAGSDPQSRGTGIEANLVVALEDFINQERQGETQNLHPHIIAFVERVLIANTLRATNGHFSLATQMLGITRGTLRKKIQEHRLLVNKFSNIADELDEEDDNVSPHTS